MSQRPAIDLLLYYADYADLRRAASRSLLQEVDDFAEEENDFGSSQVSVHIAARPRRALRPLPTSTATTEQLFSLTPPTTPHRDRSRRCLQSRSHAGSAGGNSAADTMDATHAAPGAVGS